MATIASGSKVETYLGAKAESLLGFKSPKISKDRLQSPVRTSSTASTPAPTATCACSPIFSACLATAACAIPLSLSDPSGRSRHRTLRRRQLRENPDYFDGENIVKLAVEGQCNAVASTFGVLGSLPASTPTRFPSS
jgi:class I fructose-bisphosphate aldolase